MTANKDKVGFSRRPVQGALTSGSANMTTDPYSDFVKHQSRTARIYMPQKKHVHNHPADKSIGKYWAIDFETESTFKSPLMQWTSASNDPFHSKGDNLQIRFPSVNAAIDHCEMMGFGYDVQYPNFKYHTYKNYTDNFKYKGAPKEEPEYD